MVSQDTNPRPPVGTTSAASGAEESVASEQQRGRSPRLWPDPFTGTPGHPGGESRAESGPGSASISIRSVAGQPFMRSAGQDAHRPPPPHFDSNPSTRVGESDSEAQDDMAQVLVVDDDPIVRRLVGLTLTDEGYDVAVAEDGEEALRLAAETPPDVIVLDLEMPLLDGRAAFRELRQRGVRAPILVLSANGAHAAKQELSADAAMDKPFDPLELVRRLERLLRIRIEDGPTPAGN